MNGRHLKDLDIQKFAFDQLECESYIIEHMQSCEFCKEKVSTYISLSTLIKDQPETNLEYNLADLVFEKISSEKEVEKSNNYLVKFTMLTISVFFTLILYLFSETISYLLNNSLAYQSYFIISNFIFITIVLAIDLFKSFNKKLNLLDP